MFPNVLLCALVGGLAGGDAKRADCNLVTGGCDESHERAEGINILADCLVCFFICVCRAMALKCYVE